MRVFKFSSKPIVIYGDSGSGKSTYLREIIGLTGNKRKNAHVLQCLPWEIVLFQ